MPYAKVDRSDFVPNFDGRMGDEVVDVGWAEGELSDGRPYRVECWSWGEATGVTVFVPDAGLEALSADAVNAMLDAGGLITNYVPQEITLLRFVDPAGTPCLSISYVIANAEDEHFAEVHAALQSYLIRCADRLSPTP
jgi:hypothetical protein